MNHKGHSFFVVLRLKELSMKTKTIGMTTLCLAGAAVVFAQAEPPRLPAPAPNAPAPSLQSAVDPGYAALIATCKTPPPGRGGRAGGGVLQVAISAA